MSTLAGIHRIAATAGLDTLSPSVSSAKNGADFGSALTSAIGQVNQLQTDAGKQVEQFLQGNGELHNVALSSQRADMAFDLGLQIRNKVVSAYQEIMKMQL